MSLALAGLLSPLACTAEKTAMKNPEVASIPVPKIESGVTETPVAGPAKTVVTDGIFASNDHLQPVYFELNQSKLSASGSDAVKANAEWLTSQPPFLIRVVGYADNRGSIKKNERLAERRANSVREAYIALGLAKERISIAGRGAEDAACQPLTEECLSKSRRSDTLMEDKSLALR